MRPRERETETVNNGETGLRGRRKEKKRENEQREGGRGIEETER